MTTSETDQVPGSVAVPPQRVAPPGPAGETPGSGRSLLRAERRFALALAAPGLAVLILTTTLPLLYLLGISLFTYDLSAPDRTGFVWFANYVAAFSDARFWGSLRLSAAYVTTTVTLQIVLGMALALAIERMTRGRALVRVAAILPILLAPVVVGLVWRTLMLTPDFGIVDFVTSEMGLGSHNWLGEPTLAVVSVITMHTWQWTPFAFLIFLASLATIPSEVLEAAEIDRASAWQRFWYIILPFLRPAIVVVVIVRTVIAFSAFDAIFAATGGGPGTATEILNLYIYRVSFRELSVGYGASLAVILLVITMALAWLFSRMRGRS